MAAGHRLAAVPTLRLCHLSFAAVSITIFAIDGASELTMARKRGRAGQQTIDSTAKKTKRLTHHRGPESVHAS